MNEGILIITGNHILRFTSLRGFNGTYVGDKSIQCMSRENIVLIINLNEYRLKFIKSENFGTDKFKYYRLINKNTAT
ncbi:MAG: hypothetical protein RR942_01140 [Romboutsia sp.]